MRVVLAAALALLPALAACQGSLPEQSPAPRLRIDDVQVEVLESYPVQVNVLVAGEADACAEVPEPRATRNERTFRLRLDPTRLPAEACRPGPSRFTRIVPLDTDGLPSGVYTIDVNGQTHPIQLDTGGEPFAP